jgi:acetyltransferase-like isoleucine patch superfamily enzyme
VPISLKIDKSTKIGNMVMVDKNSTIGRYTFIADGTIITKTIIGNYCSIAPGSKIGLGEHRLSAISTSVLFSNNPYDELTLKDCYIGNDVWLGANSVILRGVKVCDGAVVGANAVVTKDIPPFAIAVGVPAKVIKYRFSPDNINRIIASNWWKQELSVAKKILKSLENG